jgi:hypothetical protein
MQHFCPLDSSVPCLKSRLGNLTHNTEVLCDAGDKGHSRKDYRQTIEQEAKGKKKNTVQRLAASAEHLLARARKGVQSTGCKTPKTVWNRYSLPP